MKLNTSRNNTAVPKIVEDINEEADVEFENLTLFIFKLIIVTILLCNKNFSSKTKKKKYPDFKIKNKKIEKIAKCEHQYLSRFWSYKLLHMYAGNLVSIKQYLYLSLPRKYLQAKIKKEIAVCLF